MCVYEAERDVRVGPAVESMGSGLYGERSFRRWIMTYVDDMPSYLTPARPSASETLLPVRPWLCRQRMGVIAWGLGAVVLCSRVHLALRSEHFRAMLYGGMRESEAGTEIEIKVMLRRVPSRHLRVSIPWMGLLCVGGVCGRPV